MKRESNYDLTQNLPLSYQTRDNLNNLFNDGIDGTGNKPSGTQSQGSQTSIKVPTKLSELKNDTNFTTEDYVDSKVAELVNSAPEALDTLQELSNALGDDPNFSITIAEQIGLKANRDEIPSIDGLATEDYVTEQIKDKADKSEIPNLDGLATKEYVADQLQDKADRSELFSGSYNDLTDTPEIPSIDGLATELYVAEQIQDKADKDEIPSLVGLATEGYVDKQVQDKADRSEIPSIDGLATEDYVTEQIRDKANRSEIPSIEGLASEGYVTNAILDKADRSELFSKKYSDLTGTPEIPSIDGLASEEYVDNKFKSTLNSEILPYTYSASPTRLMLFACGFPIIIDSNAGHKYDTEADESSIVAMYNYETEVKKMIFTPEQGKILNVYGGYGTNSTEYEKNLPVTRIEVSNVTIKNVFGGHYFTGIVGTSNIIIKNATVTNVGGGGDNGSSLNNVYSKKNIVYNTNIDIESSKVPSCVFGGGGSGYAVADDVLVNVKDSTIGWLTCGGSNGYTRHAIVNVYDSKVTVAQTVNRGLVNDAEINIYGNSNITRLYCGGETEDSTVTGIVRKSNVQVYGGTIGKFEAGVSNSLTFTDPKGNVAPEATVNQYVDISADSFTKDSLKSDPQISFNEDGELVVTINGITKTFVAK